MIKLVDFRDIVCVDSSPGSTSIEPGMIVSKYCGVECLGTVVSVTGAGVTVFWEREPRPSIFWGLSEHYDVQPLYKSSKFLTNLAQIVLEEKFSSCLIHTLQIEDLHNDICDVLSNIPGFNAQYGDFEIKSNLSSSIDSQTMLEISITPMTTLHNVTPDCLSSRISSCVQGTSIKFEIPIG